MNIIGKVKFARGICDVVVERYRDNDRPALVLFRRSVSPEEDGQPVTTATVNLPDSRLADDEVAVKDYGENDGMLESLVAAGIVERPTRHVDGRFVAFPICRVPALQQASRETEGASPPASPSSSGDTLRQLVIDCLPDMEARVRALESMWPGEKTLAALRRTEGLVRRIKAVSNGASAEPPDAHGSARP